MMNCPFCETDMKQGYINARMDIVWTPTKKTMDEDPTLDPEAVLLPEESRFEEENKEAYYCESCDRVVVKPKF